MFWKSCIVCLIDCGVCFVDMLLLTFCCCWFGLCTIDIGPEENCEMMALWLMLLGEVMIEDGFKVARPP